MCRPMSYVYVLNRFTVCTTEEHYRPVPRRSTPTPPHSFNPITSSELPSFRVPALFACTRTSTPFLFMQQLTTVHSGCPRSQCLLSCVNWLPRREATSTWYCMTGFTFNQYITTSSIIICVQVRRLPDRDQPGHRQVKVIFGLDRQGFLLYEVLDSEETPPSSPTSSVSSIADV